MSYTRLLYHLVFRTKYNIPSIVIPFENDLYKYIWGFIKNKQSILYRIGGMPDHLHLLVELSAKIALANFMCELKCSSAKWLKKNKNFPDFCGWGEGYAAFTYSLHDKNTIVNYIMKQKEHHSQVSMAEELRMLLAEHGCEVKEDYFMKD